MIKQKLHSSDIMSLHRLPKTLLMEFLVPHTVFSSARSMGGYLRDAEFLVNYQSCEGKNHHAQFEKLHGLGVDGQHEMICSELGLEPKKGTSMGTAAHVTQAAIVLEAFEDLQILVATTAGVGSNAARAGDPANYYEKPDQVLMSKVGTINTLIHFNKPLSDGNLALALVTATEAKAASLIDLDVGSKQSWELATGTGTDTLALACPSQGGPALRYGGHHTKLGELLGKAVRKSIFEALEWQNGIVPSLQRSLCNLLGRFGFTQDYFKAYLNSLGTTESKLALDNFEAMIYEPRSCLCAQAIALIETKRRLGMTPQTAAFEAIGQELGLLKMAQSAHRLSFEPLEFNADTDFLRTISTAVFEGFIAKWN